MFGDNDQPSNKLIYFHVFIIKKCLTLNSVRRCCYAFPDKYAYICPPPSSKISHLIGNKKTISS